MSIWENILQIILNSGCVFIQVVTGKNVSLMDTHVTSFVKGLKVMNGSARGCDSPATPVTQLWQGFCNELQGLKAQFSN